MAVCTACGISLGVSDRYCVACGQRILFESPSTPTNARVSSPADRSSELIGTSPKHGLFGARKQLEAEAAALRSELDALGVNERDNLRTELVNLQAIIPQLREERSQLQASVEPLRAEVAFLEQEQLRLVELREEVQHLQGERDALAKDVAAAHELSGLLSQARAELAELSQSVVETRETVLLQEVGIYQYRHPLDDAPAYKARLAAVQSRVKDLVKVGSAVQGSKTWTVNGSARDGARMVREFSKLMLRAYNNEADNAVRTMKPYALDSAIARLHQAQSAITKLGGTMHIQVTEQYHRLRVEELELTADYLAKVAEQKNREREARARLREEEIARREFEREQERLRKEQAHYAAAATALRAQGDHEAAAEAEAKHDEIQEAIDGISARAANIRAGHVYIVSNVGAFGENMVKIGMTRRLDPLERVRELGDASVPFHYDVHAPVPSDDAVGLEHHLHNALAPYRVNFVNMRREFFRVHPNSVREIIDALGNPILSWVEEPEALEWRQSENLRFQMTGSGSTALPEPVDEPVAVDEAATG